MTMCRALHPKDNIDYICQEMKVAEDSSAFKIASLNQYDDSKTT